MPPRKNPRGRSKQSSPQSKAAVSAAASTHSRGAMKLTSDYRPANQKKKRAGPYKMPPPMPRGEILTDFKKNRWCLGTSVGKGGFGEIYTACRSGCSIDEAQYVVKIEPHENGPLFTELSFYTRIAKPERICEWVKSHKLPYLAIPKFIASGCHDRGGTKFRFMVMERFGEDVEKKFTAADRRFSLGTVCYLALQLLQALEFLHESEYVHADVKGSNLLTGFGEEQAHKVYLVDYGLAYRYCPDGEHKQYKEDPRKAHDGTIEFTSIDAHKGVSPSRRSDLEILGYCLIQWACGRLPWEGDLDNKDKVAKMKIKYHCDAGALLKACFGGVDFPSCLHDYMEAVYLLDYQEKPNYIKLNQLFTKQLRALGCRGDGRDTLDWITSSKVGEKRKARRKDEIEESTGEVESPPPAKKKRVTNRAADVGVGGSPAVNSAPSPAVTADVVGKQSVISQRRAATSKGQKKTTQPVVYYPKSLGYADGDGSKSSSEEEVVQPSAEEVVQPSVQKKRKTSPKKPAQAKKVLGKVDSDGEEFSSKKRRIAKSTRNTRRKT